MKKIVVLTAVLFGVVAVSCQKKAEIETPVSKVEMRTFTCTIDSETDPETKMTIDDTGKTEWVEGDKILVHGEYIGTKSGKQYSTIVELGVTPGSSISADGKTATFTIATDESGVSGIVPYTGGDNASHHYGSVLYAAYPAEAAVQTEGFHTYYYSVFNDCSVPLLAAYAKDGVFTFKHIGSIISFSMPNSEDFDQYVLEGNNEETISYDQYAVRVAWQDAYSDSGGDHSAKEVIDTPHSDKTVGPKKSISGTVTCDGSTHMIFVPGKVKFTKGFTLSFAKGGVLLKSVSTSKQVDFSGRGKLLTLGNVKNYLHAYAHTPASWTSAAEDLTAHPANCYIVYASDAGKAFKIKAVRGSGSTAIGAISSVDVLWETYNNANSVTVKTVVEKVDYSGDNNYVYFKLPDTFHSGNALIAAKDASGDVLWSWHIWAPSSSVEEGDYSANGLMTPKMLDRNLGALVVATATETANTPETFGLMYQWGRKDPFLGPRNAGTSDPYKLAGTSYSIASGHITWEYAYKHPTVFGKGTSTSLNGDWIDAYDIDLWGGDSGVKTINDPCPYGYRVPLASQGKIFSDDNGLGNYTGYGYDKNHYWFKVGDFVSPLSSYYDYNGYISSSGAGTRTIIWSATSHYNPTTKSDYAHAQYVYYENDADHSVNWTQRKARACSVRCVAE